MQQPTDNPPPPLRSQEEVIATLEREVAELRTQFWRLRDRVEAAFQPW